MGMRESDTNKKIRYLMLLESNTKPASKKKPIWVLTNTNSVHKTELSKIISLIVLRIEVCQVFYRLTFL